MNNSKHNNRSSVSTWDIIKVSDRYLKKWELLAMFSYWIAYHISIDQNKLYTIGKFIQKPITCNFYAHKWSHFQIMGSLAHCSLDIVVIIFGVSKTHFRKLAQEPNIKCNYNNCNKIFEAKIVNVKTNMAKNIGKLCLLGVGDWVNHSHGLGLKNDRSN